MLTNAEAFTCGKCGEVLPATEFYWSGTRRSGYCKPCQAAYVTEQREKARQGRSGRRLRKYGLTEEGYQQRLRDQGGVCAICGGSETTEFSSYRALGMEPELVVDHNHLTGEVRGLLCNRCNTFLGHLEKHAGLLPRALAYLGVQQAEAPKSPTTLIVASPAPALEPRLEPLEEPRDFQREAMQADLMDGSGDRNHLNSPYAARRAEQIRVLSDAFAEMFNRPLTPVAAKRWLVLTEDSAEAVLEVIEYTHAHKGSQMESPFGYIEAVLKNKRDEARKAAPQGGPGGQAAPAADNYWLSEPTERTKRVREKLLAAGLLKPEEDD